MNSPEEWDCFPDCTLWTLPRITRTRDPMGSHRVNSECLRDCAQDQQLIMIDKCSPAMAARMVCSAATELPYGMIWVVTTDDQSYRAMLTQATTSAQAIARGESLAVYDIHPAFKDAEQWGDDGFSLLLTATESLYDHSKYNPRRRKDLSELFFPLIAIVDPELLLCQKSNACDPAWAIRDIVGRLHSQVCIAVFTEREALSIFPQTLLTSFGSQGLLYLTADRTASPGARSDRWCDE